MAKIPHKIGLQKRAQLAHNMQCIPGRNGRKQQRKGETKLNRHAPRLDRGAHAPIAGGCGFDSRRRASRSTQHVLGGVICTQVGASDRFLAGPSGLKAGCLRSVRVLFFLAPWGHNTKGRTRHMFCFTMDCPGIRCDSGTIPVGESGRGRKLVSVPLPPGSVMESDIRPGGDANLLIESDGGANALLYIPDHSGFRGTWRLRDARSAEEWDRVVCTAAEHERCVEAGRGAYRADGTNEENKAAFCAASLGHDAPMGGARCPACPPPIEERKPSATVVAEGYAAQGQAGMMGGGPEYLLVLAHGQAVEIVRSGRLYGKPACLRVECVAGQVVMTESRAAAEGCLAAAAWAAVV